MNSIDVDELFKIKSFKNETGSKVQVISTQVYKYAAFKVDDQNEDASVIY